MPMMNASLYYSVSAICYVLLLVIYVPDVQKWLVDVLKLSHLDYWAKFEMWLIFVSSRGIQSIVPQYEWNINVVYHVHVT